MEDLSLKPYITCPDVEALGIQITPLWIRPKGGGPEGPAIVLRSVPQSYNTILETFGVLQIPEGWLADASDKDEVFWRRVFGNISCVMRKPATVLELDRLSFYPVPHEVQSIINAYSDDQLAVLLRPENVIGFDYIRKARKDALRGAVTCRGAWVIVKHACIDRLGRNPEDVGCFEYAWETARAQKLDSRGLPDRITHVDLLKKVVERDRVAAAMLNVLPAYYRTDQFVYFVDWKLQVMHIGSPLGGPMDRRSFSGAGQVAEALLSDGVLPLEDETQMQRIYDRVSSSVTSVDESPAAEDDLDEIGPRTGERLARVIPSVSEEIVPPLEFDEPLTSVPFSECYRRLIELSNQIESRVRISRIISRAVLDISVAGATAANTNHFLSALEQLLAIFEPVIDDRSLALTWDRREKDIISIASALRLRTGAHMRLRFILRDLPSVQSLIANHQMESEGERCGWWWQGYTCLFSSTKEWQIYQLIGNKTHPLPQMRFSQYSLANEALHSLVRNSRLTSVKRPDTASWMHVYRTSSGPLLELSEADFIDQVEANVALGAHGDSYLANLAVPHVWTERRGNWLVSDVDKRICILLDALEIDTGVRNLGGNLTWKQKHNRVLAFYDGTPLGQISPGGVAHRWGTALYRYLSRYCEEELSSFMDALAGSVRRVDMDIGIEDELLDSMECLRRPLESAFGAQVIDLLRDAIFSPSSDGELYCLGLLESSFGMTEFPDECRGFLRSLLLLTAQHRPHRHLSAIFKEKMRVGMSSEAMFSYMFAQYVGQRLRWLGKEDKEIVACFSPGDDPNGNLYVSGSLQWQIALGLEGLLDATVPQLQATQLQSTGTSL